MQLAAERRFQFRNRILIECNSLFHCRFHRSHSRAPAIYCKHYR